MRARWKRFLERHSRRRLTARNGGKPDFERLGLVRLEERIVFDAASVVADLQPGIGGSAPADLTPFRNAVYFSADGVNTAGQHVGRELYRLDSRGNTELIADINPGPAGSDPSNFSPFNDRLLFAATGPAGRELYQLDASGTVSRVADINPGSASSNPVLLTEFQGSYYFSATGESGRELYAINSGGTLSLVADINPGAASSDPTEAVVFNGSLYFAANGTAGRVLFQYNPNDTTEPQAIDFGRRVRDPRSLTEFNGKLYFSGSDSVSGVELFVLNFSNQGDSIRRVANLDGKPRSSSIPDELQVFENNLYFAATRGRGRELFRMDTDERVTRTDLELGPESSSPAQFVEFAGNLYFRATINQQATLMRIDTNSARLAAIPVTLPPSFQLQADSDFRVLGESMYFSGVGPLGVEPLRMNRAGIVQSVKDVNPGRDGSFPSEFISFGDEVYFVATNNQVGRELFKFLTTPSSLQIIADRLVFTDEDGERDNRVVVSSDGTNLRIVDENGGAIGLVTMIANTTGAGTNDVVIPLSRLFSVRDMSIDTKGGSDSVTVDISANTAAILGQFSTIHYDGGSNPILGSGDRLILVGDSIVESRYTPDSQFSGSGIVKTDSKSLSTIFVISNVEPVEMTAMARAIFTTPTAPGGSDNIFVAEGVEFSNAQRQTLVISGTVNGTTIAPAYFFGNQHVLIETSSATDDHDRVYVSGAANQHDNRNLKIVTGSNSDQQDAIFVTGSLSVTGDLSMETSALQLSSRLSIGGTTSLVARADIVVAAQGFIHSSDRVSLLADSDGVSGGRITMSDGALIQSGVGTIFLQATGDVTLGRLQTANNTSLAMQVTSLSGRILDGGDIGGADITAESTSAVTTLRAARGLGSDINPLDLEVQCLVTHTADSSQYLTERNDLASINLNAGNGVIELSSGGSAGLIRDMDGDVDVRASQWTLRMAGAGTMLNPIQTQIDRLVSSTDSSGLYLQNRGDLRVGGDASMLGLTGVHSNGGRLSLFADGTLWIVDAVSSPVSGQMELGAGRDLIIDADLFGRSGGIKLRAARDILAGPDAVIRIESESIGLMADSDQSNGGTIQIAGDIDVGSGNVIFSLTDLNGELRGAIRGNGGMVMAGPGTLTISTASANTYFGTTQILGGTLRIDGTIGAAGPAQVLTIAGGAVLTGGGDVNAPIASTSKEAKIVSDGSLTVGDGSVGGFQFVGTLLVSAGDTVVVRDADVAELGALTILVTNGRLVAVNGLEIGTGDTLAGNGAIVGDLIVRDGGQLSPGLSLGVISTELGNLKLAEQAVFVVEIQGVRPGIDYDLFIANGVVDVSGAILQVSSTMRPVDGTQFTLITNDGTEPVLGQFRNSTGQPLQEGALVRIGGVDARISYVGGVGGNDVTLTVAGLQLVRTTTTSTSASNDSQVTLANFYRVLTSDGQRLNLSSATPMPLLGSDVVAPQLSSNLGDLQARRLELRTMDHLRVFFRVINEGTKEEEPTEYPLDPENLRDLLGIFRRYEFPDGKYRIYLKEPDKNSRKILEVEVFEGKIVPPNFRDGEGSAFPDASVNPKTIQDPPVEELDRSSSDGPCDTPTHLTSDFVNEKTAWRDRVHAELARSIVYGGAGIRFRCSVGNIE